MKKNVNDKSIVNDVGYCLYADKSLMDFLRPRHDERFTKMDAYCDLLDRAVASVSDGKSDLKSDVAKFEVTITELSEKWHWHRATVRGFLADLEQMGRMSKEALSKSYLVSMKLCRFDAVRMCQSYRSFVEYFNVDNVVGKLLGQLSVNDTLVLLGRIVLMAVDSEILSDCSNGDKYHGLFVLLARRYGGAGLSDVKCPVDLIESYRSNFAGDQDLLCMSIGVLIIAMTNGVCPSCLDLVAGISDLQLGVLDKVYLHYMGCDVAETNCSD